MPAIDFSIGPAALLSLAIAIAFVPAMCLISGIPALRERNALQFLAAYVVATCAFLVGTLSGASSSVVDWLTGFMLLHCAVLLYLEVWALLSRGYTLGLLLTLYRSPKPVVAADLANEYRGGDGLEWIMKHRLGGLASAGLVSVRDGTVALTAFPGVVVARAYKLFFAALGLKKTG